MGLLIGFNFAVVHILASVVIARFADRGVRRTIIAGGLFVWSGLTALSGLATSYLQLALARIGVATAEGAGSSPAHSMLCDYFPLERRTTVLTIFGMGGIAGTALGSGVIGPIAQIWGWRYAFFVLGIPGALLALLVRLTVREPVRGAFDGARREPGERHDARRAALPARPAIARAADRRGVAARGRGDGRRSVPHRLSDAQPRHERRSGRLRVHVGRPARPCDRRARGWHADGPPGPARCALVHVDPRGERAARAALHRRVRAVAGGRHVRAAGTHASHRAARDPARVARRRGVARSDARDGADARAPAHARARLGAHDRHLQPDRDGLRTADRGPGERSRSSRGSASTSLRYGLLIVALTHLGGAALNLRAARYLRADLAAARTG